MNELLMILSDGCKAAWHVTLGVIIASVLCIGITKTVIDNKDKQLELAKTTVMQADSLLNKHNIWDADDSDLMERYSTNVDNFLGYENR